MRVDMYTKRVLTAIAACLVYLCIHAGSVPVSAQAPGTQTTRVYVAGWVDNEEFVHRLPGMGERFRATPLGIPINER
jgi:hypothetical protein